MRISLIVDNPKRDLKGIAILAYELVKTGHEVFITPMNVMRFELPRLLPDLVLLPGYRRTTYKNCKKYKDLGMHIGILETEGGFMYNEDLLVSRIEDHPDSDNVIDLFFCWGEKYHSIIKKYGHINMDKVYVTGCPRFEKSKELETSKEHILFSPNFSFIMNGVFNKNIVKFYYESFGIDVSHNFDGFVDYYHYFIHVARMLDEHFPGKVVYRPHPFDDREWLKKQLEGSSVKFDDHFSVSESLLKSAVCIQNSSTTGFEALIYKVPTIIPREVNSNFRCKEIDGMSYNLYHDQENC